MESSVGRALCSGFPFNKSSCKITSARSASQRIFFLEFLSFSHAVFTFICTEHIVYAISFDGYNVNMCLASKIINARGIGGHNFTLIFCFSTYFN
jgi:hypothetical protein